jgi:hypothetical protein
MPGYTLPAKVVPLDEMVNDTGDIEAESHPSAERTASTKLILGALPIEFSIDKLL